MFVGIAINLTGRLLSSTSPASLFANGEPGVWYDPSQINTLFQDSAGTTPVTAPNQPVGLMLDKSQGLVLGPELITNGNFSDGATGWSGSGAGGWLISGGVATHTAGTYGTLSTTATNATTAGKSYLLTFDFAGTGALNVYSRNALIASVSGTGSKRYIFTAAATSGATLNFEDQTFNGTIDNISVKLLAGNHATQATSTQRPIYGINPIVGTRNLLTYTEQFDNAAWTKSISGSATAPTVVANVATAPNGTQTADRISFSVSGTTSSDQSVIDSSYSAIANGSTYTYSIWLKATDAGNVGRVVRLYVGGFSGGTFLQSVTLSADWQRITGTAISGATSGNLGIRAQGNLSQVVLVDTWGAQLELGSTATAYQKVVSQYEVTQAGVQSAGYLAFDGVDDGMVTNTITPATNKVQVFTGARKLSDAASGMLVELGDGTSQPGIIGLRFPSLALAGATFSSRGTLSANATVGGIAAPSTNVLTGLGDIAAPSAVLRSNGVQVGIDTATQGTGNFLAYPIYIGRRAGTSNPFNGRLYSLIVRFGPNLTTGQITATETWVNGETGAY